jgi:hypothetical protein
VALVARIWQPGQDVMVDDPTVLAVDEPADSARWADGYAGELLDAHLDGLGEVHGGTWRIEILDEDSGDSPATAIRDV